MTTKMYYDLESNTNLEVWRDGESIVLEIEDDDNILTVNLQKEDVMDLISYLTRLDQEL